MADTSPIPIMVTLEPQLTKALRKLETGFYDGPEVREHIARRVREELGP
jgi:hypothetical protein